MSIFDGILRTKIAWKFTEIGRQEVGTQNFTTGENEDVLEHFQRQKVNIKTLLK